MIKSFKELRGGQYVADFRYDEGIRVREEFVSPTLTKSLREDGSISNCLILIEVKEDGMETDAHPCREKQQSETESNGY